MKDIKKKCNLIMNLSKFTFNKKKKMKLQLLTTTGFVTKFFPQLNRVCHKSGPNFE